LEGKRNKDYVTLVVIFDDYMGFMDEKGKIKLNEFIKNKLDQSSLKCESIYLLGISGENLWSVRR